jgi:uncharacterized protein
VECPVCDDVALVISSREGVEIDHCPQCRGVWLDRGELDKIIDRTASFAPAPADHSDRSVPDAGYRDPRPEPSRYDDDRYDDRRRRSRRRSFLEELFDFD